MPTSMVSLFLQAVTMWKKMSLSIYIACEQWLFSLRLGCNISETNILDMVPSLAFVLLLPLARHHRTLCPGHWQKIIKSKKSWNCCLDILTNLNVSVLPSLIAPPMAIVNDHVFELHCKWCMKYDLSRHLSSFLCDILWYDLWHRLGILRVFQNERRGRKRGSVKLWEHVNTYVISSLLRARNCHLSPPYSVTARESERKCVCEQGCVF